jgi:cytochrome c2
MLRKIVSVLKGQYFPILVKFLVSFIVMSVVTLSFADDAKDAALRTAEKLCQNTYPTSIENCSIVFSRMHGNCLACHFIQGGTQTGNIGPTLFSMKQRFPDKAVF